MELGQCAADCKSAGFIETALSPKHEESTNSRFMSSGQVEMSLRENDQIFVMFTSLRVESDVIASVMPLIYEFPDSFPKDIYDFLSEQEVEFSIDLVSSTRPVSMAPYKMFVSELGELKK